MSSIQIPTWLDATKEVDPANPSTPTGKKLYDALGEKEAKAFFLLTCLAATLQADPEITVKKALEVVANAVVETGWGKSWVEYNFGGWKINRADVEAYRLAHNGESPRWWRAAGHTKSGDAPVVFYQVFKNPDSFFKAWLLRFVPKNKKPGEHRYAVTGAKFWNDDPSWFFELCVAGYKGEVTAANPGPSVAAHKSIITNMKPLIAQKLLEVTPDGVWERGTIAACQRFQAQHNLSVTGTLTAETFSKLIEVWKASDYQL